MPTTKQLRASWVAYGNRMLQEQGARGWRFAAVTPDAMLAGGFHRDTVGYTCPLTRTVGLSTEHIENDCACQLQDTVRHEIAHALVLDSAPEALYLDPHGSMWQAFASACGAAPLAGGLEDCACA